MMPRIVTTKPPIKPRQIGGGNLTAKWLPPRDEWDFRSITPEKCRLACLWEYARSVETIVSDPAGWIHGKYGKKGKGANTILAYHLMRGGDISMPWVTFNNTVYKLISVRDLKNPA